MTKIAIDNRPRLQKLQNMSKIRTKAGTSDIGTINSNDIIAATQYALGTWFVSGIYV